MTAQDLVKFWRTTSAEDMITAQMLLQNNRYHDSLFFCHLSIEKLLKGLVYAKTNEPPAPIHNLLALAKQAKLPLDTPTEEKLKEITSWNINARYDDYKRNFYHKATKKFTLQWFDDVQKIIIWIQKHF